MFDILGHRSQPDLQRLCCSLSPPEHLDLLSFLVSTGLVQCLFTIYAPRFSILLCRKPSRLKSGLGRKQPLLCHRGLGKLGKLFHAPTLDLHPASSFFDSRRRHALEPFHPQRSYLSLLTLGDGTAIGTKWGFAFTGRCVDQAKTERKACLAWFARPDISVSYFPWQTGRWVWHLKSHIDTKWMKSFAK